MKQWRVGPTMIRGSNRLLDELPVAARTSKKRKATSSKNIEQSKENPKDEKAAKTKTKKKKDKADPLNLDLGPDTLNRKNKERPQACRSFFEELLRLDQAAFQSSPLFTQHGVCRLKFAGADQLTLNEALDNVADAFLTMQLGFPQISYMCLDE